MIIEIEYFKGDILLYGKRVSMSDLKRQMEEIENAYDRTADNFTALLCRRFGWECLKTAGEKEVPAFTYDRDVQRLYRRRAPR